MIFLPFFAVGLFFGSFANVISLRLHSKKPGIMNGRSECPTCHHPLSWYENIPLVAFLLQRGKSRCCKTPISCWYPASELLFGFLFGITGVLTSLDDPLLLLWRCLLVFSLGIFLLSDIRFFEIPDEVSLPTIAFLLLSSLFFPSPFIPSLGEALLGALVVYGFFTLQILTPALITSLKRGTRSAIVSALSSVLLFPFWIVSKLFFVSAYFEKKFPEETEEEDFPSWIGGGDLRIALIMGLALGWKVGLLAVFLSYILGTLVALPLLPLKKYTTKSLIPFGPMLATATFLCLFWGEEMLTLYLSLVWKGAL